MLKPEVSIPVAAATCALTFGIYQFALPSLADTRTVEAGNDDIARAERQALLLAVGVSGGVSLLARDAVPFIVSGLFAVALSWVSRHANMVDPVTGRVADLGQQIIGDRRYDVEEIDG